MTLQPKQTVVINHSQFMTWREFTSYFDDYKEIQERNKKADLSNKSNDTLENNLLRKIDRPELDPDQEFKNQMENEKQNKVLEIPMLRPAD